jgi:hypothetical protein
MRGLQMFRERALISNFLIRAAAAATFQEAKMHLQGFPGGSITIVDAVYEAR